MRHPTRGPYLLDLVLTNDAKTSASVGPKISEHHTLVIRIPDAVEKRNIASRVVWEYKDADWRQISESLENENWSCLQQGSVDDALDYFYNIVDQLMQNHIPQSVRTCQKSTLP